MAAPTYQLFPALSESIEAALRASIRRFGVLVPVVKDQHGNILDGHHRSRIADELNITYRVDIVAVADDEEARAIVETLNTDRGHRLKADMRREVVADLREEGHSLRAIAGAVGVDKETVRKDLLTVDPSTVPDRITGLDGKSRPARRPAIVAVKSNRREEERAYTALALVDALPTSAVVDVKRVERIAREAEAERRRQEPQPARQIVSACDLRIGFFADVLEDDLEADVIITDPPYGLSAAGVQVFYHHAFMMLRPGGHLVALLGQLDIPTYMQALTDDVGFDFRWLCAWMTPGAATRMHSVRVGTNWKPILVLQALGDFEDDTTPWLLGDVFHSPGDDKTYHHWGQNLEGFKRLVEAFSKPGDLVVDPFLGGGTTAVACRDLGRRFIGCDVDPAAVATTRERLA